MKVCLVGPAHPYRGGIAHFTSMLAREFAREHEVLVVNFRRLYPSLLFPGKTQYDTSESPLQVASERIVDSINPLSFLTAARRIAHFDADLVVFQWWQPFFGPAFGAIARRVRRTTTARVVFLCHNVLPHESSAVDRTLIRIGLGGADAFVVQSREDGDNLRRLVPGATVAYNPHPVYDWFEMGHYNAESAREALGVAGRVVLFFGLIRPYKGLSTLLEAFGLCGDGLDATLIIAGEFYESRAPYDDLVSRLGLGDRVRVVDRYVPNEEVEMYFKAADLVVLPYRSATQSGVVQTAYTFGKPVVVTRVGGLPDVVDDGQTGYVVPPDDPGALAAAIEKFFTGDEAERMPAAIREALPRFSWARCVETIVGVAQGGGQQ